jgi:pSer/pThr/pTyr-binding forkhead associated (FHA) protein
VRVRVTAGPAEGSELVLDAFGRAYVLGRLPSADLHVDDADLSRRHVELIRRGDRVLVKDLGSKNGTSLGDDRLPANEEVPWPRGRTLTLGKTVLAYDDPVGEALDELERAADERIPESEIVEPPRGGTPSPDRAPAAAAPASTAKGSRAPVTARPNRAAAPDDGSWTALDVVAVLLAVIVLTVSIGALVWLMRGG